MRKCVLENAHVDAGHVVEIDERMTLFLNLPATFFVALHSMRLHKVFGQWLAFTGDDLPAAPMVNTRVRDRGWESHVLQNRLTPMLEVGDASVGAGLDASNAEAHLHHRPVERCVDDGRALLIVAVHLAVLVVEHGRELQRMRQFDVRGFVPFAVLQSELHEGLHRATTDDDHRGLVIDVVQHLEGLAVLGLMGVVGDTGTVGQASFLKELHGVWEEVE